MCFGCSKEPSHRDGSFEYPQYKFWMRNKENSFPIPTLIWSPDHIFCVMSLTWPKILCLNISELLSIPLEKGV